MQQSAPGPKDVFLLCPKTKGTNGTYMIKKNTWIVLGAFAVVLIAAIAWQYNLKERVIKPEATPTIQANPSEEFFPGLDVNNIASIEIQSTDGKTLLMNRDASGLWVVSEPEGGTVDPALADTLASQIAALRTLTSMNPQDDLSVYGLSAPVYIIQLVLNGGEKHIIYVGDEAPTGTAYYVQLNGSAPKAVAKYDLDAVLDFLTNPPLLPTPAPETSPTPGETPTGPTSTP
jgi:hypothetical protein